MLLFGLSENLYIFPLPVDKILLIIRASPAISMCTLLHQLLSKVFHVLPFTLFCASPASLTLSVLELLIVLCYYFSSSTLKSIICLDLIVLCVIKIIIAFLCNISIAGKNKMCVYISVTFWKTLSGQRNIKYEQMWGKYICIWNDSSSFHSSELFYLSFRYW